MLSLVNSINISRWPAVFEVVVSARFYLNYRFVVFVLTALTVGGVFYGKGQMNNYIRARGYGAYIDFCNIFHNTVPTLLIRMCDFDNLSRKTETIHQSY